MAYDTKIIKAAHDMRVLGHTIEQINLSLGVSTRTLYRWLKYSEAPNRKPNKLEVRRADRYIMAHKDEPGFIEAYLESKTSHYL